MRIELKRNYNLSKFQNIENIVLYFLLEELYDLNFTLCTDLSVVCGDVEYYNESETVLSNPILLIEVLSKSTKDYDKGGKFELYRSIPSFKEYMIIYQTILKVQTWYKESEELWRLGNAEGLDQSIYLHSIGCTIKLADIYKRVKNLQEIPRDISSVY